MRTDFTPSMHNDFTTDLLRMAITSRFAYANFTEDKTTVPCPVTSIAARERLPGRTFAIDFRWQERDQPYPDYVIRTLIEFKPNGDFRILKAEGHGSERLIRTDGLADWVGGWWGNDTLFVDELAAMCICDFNEAHIAADAKAI